MGVWRRLPVEVLVVDDDLDLALEAHRAAEKHLEECWASLDDETIEPETAGPFCGCETCVIRETLHAAWPHLRKLALSETV